MVHLSNEPFPLYSKQCFRFHMAKSMGTIAIFAFMVILTSTITISPVLADTGFTNVQKSAGIIMKFCANETFKLQDCNERYEGIGWTDRVNVLIYAPGWNEDDDKIEQIGTTSNPIDVYTDANRVNGVEFTETGPDTGIFMGVVKLTGAMRYTVHDTFLTTVKTPGMTMDPDGMNISAHDRAVMIATSTQDGRLTVDWEYNEDQHVYKTAYYTWQMGQAEFHKDTYDVNEKVTFFIRDTDLWKHHREFFTNYVKVYSDSDKAGIFVGVQFVKDMDHAKIQNAVYDRHLSEPAASSLTKYTPDGEWKTYLWTEPGGVIGVDQDYDFNLMVHDGLTDIHEMGLSYDMDIYLNGELIESRNDQYWVDGQGVEPIRFDERGSAKIVVSNIFDQPGQEVNFSFQVAPEAILEEVVPRHGSFEVGSTPNYFVGYEHPHYINYLPGEFFMTTGDSSQEQNRLRVTNGDTIYIEYEDITLPRPYTTADSMEIVARALVLDTGVHMVSDDSEIFVETPRPTVTPVSSDIDMSKPTITSVSTDIAIPDWVKKNAMWWSDGQINDPDFAKGIEYLVQENIISVSAAEEIVDEDVNITSIPMWVRNNAGWWSEGHLTDVEFANGIKFLMASGLIKV
ncbi:hypothetical protein Nmar_1638 [Nitrosopumilus maritimus SCM1]|uniref:Secreted periplasmic Zn-dependent protease n=2 Tax=Nitrosopumilus maritimus TaxID=338192 RepID=A9A1L9_NITMS|nr:hypothetical protein Nmar_1638 [Nitrosopumilus maritimus SCM1]